MRIYIPSGTAQARPVGMAFVSFGRIVVEVQLVMSYPIEPVVALDGIVADGKSLRICIGVESASRSVACGRHRLRFGLMVLMMVEWSSSMVVADGSSKIGSRCLDGLYGDIAMLSSLSLLTGMTWPGKARSTWLFSLWK